jgi:hypothetical protein
MATSRDWPPRLRRTPLRKPTTLLGGTTEPSAEGGLGNTSAVWAESTFTNLIASGIYFPKPGPKGIVR